MLDALRQTYKAHSKEIAVAWGLAILNAAVWLGIGEYLHLQSQEIVAYGMSSTLVSLGLSRWHFSKPAAKSKVWELVAITVMMAIVTTAIFGTLLLQNKISFDQAILYGTTTFLGLTALNMCLFAYRILEESDPSDLNRWAQQVLKYKGEQNDYKNWVLVSNTQR